MSHYQLNPKPQFTATEMLLLGVIDELTRRLTNFENAVIYNLPAVRNQHQVGHYSVQPMLDLLEHRYPELLITNGTFRTTSQLDHFLATGNLSEDNEVLASQAMRKPQIQPVQHGGFTEINFQFTYDQLYRVFSSMAVPVDKLPDPSVEGEGWNIVSIKDRVYAYYTYSAPNRVTELVWAGSARSENGKVDEVVSGADTPVVVYLPLESIWITVRLNRVVSPAARTAAIRELFETLHGIPMVERTPSGSAMYERMNANNTWLAHYILDIAGAGQIETIEPQTVDDGKRWSGYESTYFLFDYDDQKWEFAITSNGIAWRHATPWSVSESFIRALTSPSVVALAEQAREERLNPAN